MIEIANASNRASVPQSKSNLTPMMRQYHQIKSQYPDAILFYRLGDFYEMFDKDAIVAAKALDLTLTTRNKNQEDATPLCGIPYHAAQNYIPKLIRQGHKVAICEQTEDPKKAKGIVKREVTKVITPGMVLDSTCLDKDQINYLAALHHHQNIFCLSVCDISTGYFKVTQSKNKKAIIRELIKLNPSEVLVEDVNFWNQEMLLGQKDKMSWRLLASWHFDFEFGLSLLERYFSKEEIGESFFKKEKVLTQVSGALLSYVSENKLLTPGLIEFPIYFQMNDHLVIDPISQNHLEIFFSNKDGTKKNSLFGFLDRAQTAMGSRTLRQWLHYPLIDEQKINARFDAIDEILNNPKAANALYLELENVGDIERLINRVVAGICTPTDLVALRFSISKLDSIKKNLEPFQTDLLLDLKKIDLLDDILQTLNTTLKDSPNGNLREGGVIQEGYSASLDQLRSLYQNSNDYLKKLEVAEREKHQIPSLKIRYNKVFGYYIEIPHTHKNKVPADYERKQTLTQAERYIHPELKDIEVKILSAKEQAFELEKEIFEALRLKLCQKVGRIKQTAQKIAVIDGLLTLANVAKKENFVRPEILNQSILEVWQSRHPLVEKNLIGQSFVANDLFLNQTDNRMALITGPNMAGKSTVMRQVALISLLAQIGSFVPAKKARLGLLDRIFTRIGAHDSLSDGQSTFMVEMLETADILERATDKSLILLDEIGRGTSTFDGLSIAWAVSEYISQNLKSLCLFATHYHELISLADQKNNIFNLHLDAKQDRGKLYFLRQLKKGGTSKSYGVEVAKMAKLPEAVILRARTLLQILEKKQLLSNSEKQKPQFLPKQESLFSPTKELISQIQNYDLNNATPMEALNQIKVWQERLNNECKS